MSKRLELRFMNEDGKNVTISLDEPVEPVDETAIDSAMEAVILSNMFLSSGGDITEKRDARIVERTVNTVYEG
ncbi:Protein of unknown function [Alteribacillus persepolensis]|uniref:DUF2922 domain-containing protein n=1 Tax=Alteribacillus persepolensis TaxID=568899 RepID=A0A1G8GLJ9_9BACI|nr:DUF2922 domain-containing protein [Alteribacillus persepolensis]SDH95288.1 Protein of unknown function [Alteribacillus persepolensis]